MKNNFKKVMGFMTALLIIFGVFTGTVSVFAEHDLDGAPGEYKKQVEDNYWAELSWYEDAQSGYKNIIPTYLKDHLDSSTIRWATKENDLELPSFPNMGMLSDKFDDPDTGVNAFWIQTPLFFP